VIGLPQHRVAAGNGRRLTAGTRLAPAFAECAIELTLLLSVPCLVAFVIVPELIMPACRRGAFTAAMLTRALTLMAYAHRALPFVLMRSVSAAFRRGRHRDGRSRRYSSRGGERSH